MTQRPIICLGAAVWDTIFQLDTLPDGGGKVLPTAAVQLASGMATAAAISIARLGGEVKFWGRIGDDANGQMYLQSLAEEGVDTRTIRQVEGGKTAFSTILVDREGERLVVPYYDPQLDSSTDWLPLAQVKESAAVLCDMRWPDGSERLLREAREQGVPAVLDADVAPVHELRRLMPLADHLLLSQPALKLLQTEGDVSAQLLALTKTVDAQVVGVTLGAEGALVWDKLSQQLQHIEGFNITARDTLNAGDVWHGAYTLGLAQGLDLQTRVQLANLAAAMKSELFGGWRGAPNFTELASRADHLGLANVRRGLKLLKD